MMAFPFFGAAEIMVLLMLAGNVGIPLGIPPEKEDPLMARVAPAECVFYMTWAGMAEPDAASGNHTEQLLAEPEVREFILGLEGQITRMIKTAAEEGGGPPVELAAEVGPQLAKALLTRPTAVYVSQLEMREGAPPVIRGGMVVNVDKQTAEIRAALEKLQTLALGPGREAEKVTIDDGEYYRLQLAPDAPAITWGIRGKYLVVGVGEGGLEELFKNAHGETPAWLLAIKKDLAVERISSVGYVDFAKLYGQFAPLIDEPDLARIMKAIGVDKLGALASVTGLDAEGHVARTRIDMAPPEGSLLTLLDSKPLAAADLATVPHDATFAAALRLDAGKALDALVATIGAMDERGAEEFNEAVAEMERALGFDLRKELLPSLGDVWTIYASPTDGGIITGWTATVAVRDAGKLADIQDRIVAAVKAEFGDDPYAPRIKTTEYEGTMIHYVSMPGDELPLAPAWCVCESHVVVGLFPQSVKAHLARRGEPSLADNPAVVPLLADGDGPVALTYTNSRALFEMTYAQIQIMVQAMSAFGRGAPTFDIASLPSTAAVSKHLQPTVSVVRRTQSGIETYRRQTLPTSSVGASAPVLIALLLPAVQAARGAAARVEGSNNLRQIALAMHVFNDVYGGLPAAYSADAEGKPLLSWRVHILPYIEEEALYDEFHLDEPWDSEHNIKLVEMMPKVYAAPGTRAEHGHTNYLTIRHKDSMIQPPKEADNGKPNPLGSKFADITDGLSNTIMVVEAADERAVPWTKPDDFVPDDMKRIAGLVGLRRGGFNAALGDGSVQLIPAAIDSDVLLWLFSRSDGNAIPDDFGAARGGDVLDDAPREIPEVREEAIPIER